MALFKKCDFCAHMIEEGHGYVCKCCVTEMVCWRCAAAGLARCPTCHIQFKKSVSGSETIQQ